MEKLKFDDLRVFVGLYAGAPSKEYPYGHFGVKVVTTFLGMPSTAHVRMKADGDDDYQDLGVFDKPNTDESYGFMLSADAMQRMGIRPVADGRVVITDAKKLYVDGDAEFPVVP